MPDKPWNGETCEYGYPKMCGEPAVYQTIGAGLVWNACEEHARLMHERRYEPSKYVIEEKKDA